MSFLPFNELLEGVSKLLSDNGLFTTIIPFKEKESFVKMAAELGLFLNECLHVKGNPTAEIKRVLLTFSRNEHQVRSTDLIIETDRHVYTAEYVDLTKEFYLKM